MFPHFSCNFLQENFLQFYIFEIKTTIKKSKTDETKKTNNIEQYYLALYVVVFHMRIETLFMSFKKLTFMIF